MKLFAFWPYDTFPFILGSEVMGDMRDDGRIQAAGYGPGYWFKPIKLLPVKTGLALKEKLKALEAEENAALAAIRAEFRERLVTLLDEHDIELKSPSELPKPKRKP